MQIDSKIIENFLIGGEDYAKHWIFSKIREDGTYLFEKPPREYKEKLRAVYAQVNESLRHFVPYNQTLIETLFPKWKMLEEEIHIVLAVGCPKPYDAMTREHDGIKYLIFDLVRFLEYKENGADICGVIHSMITHEFIHYCIHNDYSMSSEKSYVEKMANLVFDEGFAHLLSYNENIAKIDFSLLIEEHYKTALEELERALEETDVKRQQSCLERADCGNFWEKYGAICGMLYLASKQKQLAEIYQAGPLAMIKNMGLRKADRK